MTKHADIVFTSRASLDGMIQDFEDFTEALRAFRDGDPEEYWKPTLQYWLERDGSLCLWSAACIRCQFCGDWRLDMECSLDGDWACKDCQHCLTPVNVVYTPKPAKKGELAR